MPQSPLLVRAQQQLHLYLPAILMAGLALGTWYLVHKTPAPSPGIAAPESVGQQDYSMETFSTAVYAADGQAEQLLQGVHLAHFNNQTLVLRQVQLLRQVRDKQGLSTRTEAQAQQAMGRDDGSDLTLKGSVRLASIRTASPVLRLQAQQVRIYEQGQRLQAQHGVRVVRDNLSLQGQSMDWDGATGLLKMQRGVTARLTP